MWTVRPSLVAAVAVEQEVRSGRCELRGGPSASDFIGGAPTALAPSRCVRLLAPF